MYRAIRSINRKTPGTLENTEEMDQRGKAGTKRPIGFVFEAAAGNLDELTDDMASYVSFCEDVCANQDLLHIQLSDLQQIPAAL